MTKEEFYIYWNSMFSKTLPISYLFKHDYPYRWFRIHSLPKSKRYAENELEWDILLKRQNQIISDLFGENAEILIVTGEHNWGEIKNHITDEEEIFKPYNFVKLDSIELFILNSKDYDEDEIYKPAFAESIWKSQKFDDLLRLIANEQTIAFFICIKKNIIIAPYDGGIDIVLENTKTRDIYKEKYKDWLSQREDGF